MLRRFMCFTGLLPLIAYAAGTATQQTLWHHDNYLMSRNSDIQQNGAPIVLRHFAQMTIGESNEKNRPGKQAPPTNTAQDWKFRVLTQPFVPGPLPQPASSDLLETLGTGFSYDFKSIPVRARCSISLRAKTELSAGVYLEAQFQNPARPDTFLAIGQTYQKKTLNEARAPIFFISPELVGTKCTNYEVVVSVYSDTTKATLLGTHRQLVQSRVDTDRLKSIEECGEIISQGENLNFPTPLGWSLINRSRQGNVHLEEYLPFGQAVDNWKEMMTVIAIHGQQVAPETYLRRHQESNWKECPRASKEEVLHSQEEGIPIATTVLVCGHVPATDKAEVSVIKALAGKENFYEVHRQWRVPAGDPAQVSQSLRKEINAGFELLRNARVCDTRDPVQRCEIPPVD